MTLLDVTGTQLGEKDLGALARGRGVGIRDEGGPRVRQSRRELGAWAAPSESEGGEGNVSKGFGAVPLFFG